MKTPSVEKLLRTYKMPDGKVLSMPLDDHDRQILAAVSEDIRAACVEAWNEGAIAMTKAIREGVSAADCLRTNPYAKEG